ncbi:MAG: UDP-N-acetylmuramate dehydrogenase [Bacteroidia bacterium]|nr:UDP-N-acetylmuramate dehydrogenase [Bacteroidia bacterium]MDW8416455.1 UDP-N-acetylmuramate dehydrogenase [Bacteroidia bacterium]
MIPFREYHTLGISVSAQRLLLPHSEDEVPDAAAQSSYVIGEGSNILPLGDLPSILSTRNLRGYRVLRASENSVEVEVAAGENWDRWVRLCIAQGWHGLENLAAIPGTVGAAVVQNIGAYGAELAPFLVSVRGWNKALEAWQELPAEACELNYRYSIFQQPEWRDKFIITRVTLRLNRRFSPVLSYPDVMQRVNPTRQHDPWHLYETVRMIRAEKLPAYGSAGSFFKNPILSLEELKALQSRAPEVPFYAQSDGRFKVAAAWLIDKAGLKGYRIGGAQVYPRQPLVLVNADGATPEEFYALVQHIQKSVYERWGVQLEPEVRLLPPT